MGEKNRIGIMGGTFDPIHIGHLILAEAAREQYDLHQVLIMPNGKPEYKDVSEITSASHRIAMIERAIEDNHYFRFCDIEIKRDGYTYTYETLLELKKLHPDNEYYFIMGADSLFAFETWKCPEIICRSCILLLANRNRTTQLKLEEQMNYLTRSYHAEIQLLDCPNVDISSNIIRDKVKEDQSIRYYVTKEVEQYIKKQGLYKETGMSRLLDNNVF